MKKITFLFLSAFFIAAFGLKLQAQQNQAPHINCYQDIMIKQKLKGHPELINQYLENQKKFKKLIEDIENGTLTKGVNTDTLVNGRRVIPVVIHVIHNYGPEFISDEQAISAITALNTDYNKLNADTASTFQTFKSRAANFKLEFRLAKIDPQGNCTNGIDKIYDPETNYAYFSTMAKYNWNPKKYLNVYCVNFIYPEGVSLPDGAFIGGMSPFPTSDPLGALMGGDSLSDGVLIRQDCIGTVGTATNMGGMGINALNRTFTHEMGHYLSLYHTFQNIGLMFGIIPQLGADGCDQGSWLVPLNNDEVDDTPPIVAATQSTSLACYTPGSRNTCTNDVPDEPDMVENYMDYQNGYCANIFTQGQFARANAIIMGQRRALWSYENLVYTGVWDTSYHPLCKPKSDFNCNLKAICPGGSITFTPFISRAAADTYEWTFPGGTPATSNLLNPVVTYNTPGVYAVTLTVTNVTGSDSYTRQNLITVSDPTAGIPAPILESFETGDLSNWMIKNMDSQNAWVISDSASYTGTKCLRLANFYGNKAGSLDEAISPAYNLSGNTPYKIKFKLCYAGKKIPNNALAQMLTGQSSADTIYDNLQLLVSKDCGQTWTARWARSGSALSTCGLDSNNFIPTAILQWREETVVLPTNFSNNPNFRFKFLFRSKGGQNVYIDDINLDVFTNIELNNEIAKTVELGVFPNPVEGSSTISFNLITSENVNLKVYDALGREAITLVNGKLDEGQHQYSISKEQLPNSGMYMVKLFVGNQSFTKKILVN